MILALDISTAIVGFAIFRKGVSVEETLVHADAVVLKNTKNYFDKINNMKKVFKDIHEKYDITEVYVEEALKKFSRGRSSAHTLILLAKFNGTLCYLIREIFGIEPKEISASIARDANKIKLLKKDPNKKETIFKWVKSKDEFGVFNWPMRTFKSGPRKGTTIYHESCYDISDAAVIGYYALGLR
jgi:hypothetical protein